MARRPRPGSVRNVVTGRSDGYTGRVPFPRLFETVAFESLLARDFLVVTAAFETDIAAIASEPTTLVIEVDGEPSRWTPDYGIERIDGTLEYVEVKPIEQVDPRRARHPVGDGPELERRAAASRARFKALGRASEEDGRRFRLVTEDEIRVEPMLHNAAVLLDHGDSFYPAHLLLAGREALARHRPEGIAPLQERLPDIDAFVLAIRLQWAGELDIERDRPFARDSRFTLAGGGR